MHWTALGRVPDSDLVAVASHWTPIKEVAALCLGHEVAALCLGHEVAARPRVHAPALHTRRRHTQPRT